MALLLISCDLLSDFKNDLWYTLQQPDRENEIELWFAFRF